MRSALLLTAMVLGPAIAPAQNRFRVEINAETPEGQLLQQIGQEQDAAKKMGLMETFAAKHPKHPSFAWVLAQMQVAYQKANQFDKVFGTAEQLLAFDPSDAEMVYGGLQAAVSKDEAAQIVKWARLTFDAAKKGEQSPKPQDEDEEERWKYKVEFSKQVQKRCEYELFAGAGRSSDPAAKLALLEGLAQMNPQSERLAATEGVVFVGLRQAGQNDKAIEVAEKSLAGNRANEDMLLGLANGAFEKGQQDRAVELSTKLVDYLKAKPAPEGASPDDWDKKKKTSMGAGLWIKGMAYGQQNKMKESDEVLREALPLIEGNEVLLGGALFQLGFANYRMGREGKKPDMKRIQEALKFSQQSAAIKGPFQAQAAKNVGVIKQQYALK